MSYFGKLRRRCRANSGVPDSTNTDDVSEFSSCYYGAPIPQWDLAQIQRSRDAAFERTRAALFERAQAALLRSQIKSFTPAAPREGAVEDISTPELVMEMIRRGFAVMKLPENGTPPETLEP